MADNCVLQSEDACVLYEKDCETAYKGKNVQMDHKFPYQITAQTNIW